MASPQPNNFNFPFFPSPPFRPFHLPPPPPSHPFSPPPPPRRAPPPPPPRVPPPPPPHVRPPPPPHVRPPPPPSHPIAPPPPHVRPPPAPVPPSPAPHHHTVIVIVFVSLGGLLFLSLLAFALFCFIKRRKKKASQEMGMVHFDERKKVKEEIVSGPFGQKVVVMTVEDDVHIDAEVKKKEKFGDGLHEESSSTLANDGVNSSGHEQDVGVKRFNKFYKKGQCFENFHKGRTRSRKEKKEQIVCYNCGKLVHIKSECSNYLNNKDRKKIKYSKKKVFVLAIWGDSSLDEDSDNEEVANICLVAQEESEEEEVND